MAREDQPRPAGRGFYAAATRWKFVVLSVFVFVLSLSVYWTVGKGKSVNADTTYNGVTFWTEITGSDKDGFDLYAANPGPAERKCKATVTVTLSDGSKKSFDYSGTVRKTDKMSFGGEAGLKPAPISEAKITSGSCE